MISSTYETPNRESCGVSGRAYEASLENHCYSVQTTVSTKHNVQKIGKANKKLLQRLLNAVTAGRTVEMRTILSCSQSICLWLSIEAIWTRHKSQSLSMSYLHTIGNSRSQRVCWLKVMAWSKLLENLMGSDVCRLSHYVARFPPDVLQVGETHIASS